MKFGPQHRAMVSEALQRSNVAMPFVGRIMRLITKLLGSGSQLGPLLDLIEGLFKEMEAKQETKAVTNGKKS